MKTKNFNFNLFFTLTLALLYFVYSAVLSPIYTSICSDIIWLESYLPYVLELLLEICQLLIWVHLFSCLIYAFKRKSLLFFSVFTVVLTIARYLFSPVLNITKGGALDFTELLVSLEYFGVDILILTVVFLSLLFGRNKTDIAFCRLGALVSAILLSASKIITRIIFDIFYGAPQSVSEILIMIFYYFFDIIYGIAACFLIYCLSKLLLKEKNSQ